MDSLIRSYWLPTGFLLLLAGLFILPTTHDYKLLVNYLLLIPALLAALRVPQWWVPARESSVLLALVCGYLLYMAGAAYFFDPINGFEFLQWTFYIVVFLIGAGLCMQIAPRRLRALLWWSFLIAVAAATYGLVRDILSGAIRSPEYRLVGYGALYNPLRSGHLWGVFFVIGLWFVLVAETTRLKRVLAAMGSAIILVAILYTGSRSPLLALFAMALWLAAFEAPRKYRLRYFGVICCVAMVLLAMFWSSLTQRGMSLRPELWSIVIARIPEHLWFGAGLGKEIEMTASNGLVYFDTHNIFLAVLYYGGIVGLSLFAALYGYAFWSAWRYRRQSTLCALSAPLQLFGIATLQFDGGSLIGRPTEFWLLYWVPIALTLYACRYRQLAEE